jgi:uncharacterized membrane protein
VAEGGRHERGSAQHPFVLAQTRVLVAFSFGLVTFGVALFLAPWQVASLIGWVVAAGVLLAWIWRQVSGMDAATTAEHARAEDSSRLVADVLLIVACAASLVGVAMALLEAGDERGATKALITTVAGVSLVLSWLVVNTVFTLRYASLYYVDGYLEGKGIDFNDGLKPTYGDFAYLAFTIGMTYQVSDTSLTAKRIRMTALRHAFLSFVFVTSVIAMTINVVAGLFTG